MSYFWLRKNVCSNLKNFTILIPFLILLISLDFIIIFFNKYIDLCVKGMFKMNLENTFPPLKITSPTFFFFLKEEVRYGGVLTNLTCDDLHATSQEHHNWSKQPQRLYSPPLKATATVSIPFIFFVHALLDLPIHFGRCYFQFQKHSLQTHPFPSTCITVLKKKKLKN